MIALTRLKQTLFSWLRAQKIVVKLRLAFGALACLTVFVGLFGLFVNQLLATRVDMAYQQDLPVVSAIKEAGISQLKAMRVLMRVVLAAGDAEEIEKLSRDLTAALAAERKQVSVCRSKLKSAAGTAQLDAATKLIPKFEKGASDIVAAAKAGDVLGFRNTITELIPVSDQIQHSFDEVSNITESQARRSKLSAILTYWGARLFMLPLLLGSAVLGATMSFIMSSLIAAPLNRIVKILGLVAKGDLTQRLPENSSDEMGQLACSLNGALGSIRTTMQQVNDSSLELKATSCELAGMAEVLSDGAMTQAANLEETSASLEEISATIRANADYASRANELGSSARVIAEEGDDSVTSAILAMKEIRNSSDEISNILSAIHDIAFQSNLLAINASIEAARAGESGRSFAVVATEMRYLAERSKGYGNSIEELVAKSVDRVNKGSLLVDHSGKALANIIDSVKQLSQTVQEIDEACRQQTQGVEQAAIAMTKVDVVVQENTAKTQNLSASAQKLAGVAVGLTETLNRFDFKSGSTASALQHDDLADSINALKTWIASHYAKVRGRMA